MNACLVQNGVNHSVKLFWACSWTKFWYDWKLCSLKYFSIFLKYSNSFFFAYTIFPIIFNALFACGHSLASKTKIFNHSVNLFLDEVFIRLKVVFLEIFEPLKYKCKDWRILFCTRQRHLLKKKLEKEITKLENNKSDVCQ